MSFEMGYLADVKGDMARLGYLKILTSITLLSLENFSG